MTTHATSELDDRDPPARHGSREEVHDRAVLELCPERRCAHDDRDKRQEHPDPELAQQAARHLELRVRARLTQSEQDGDDDQEHPEQREQQRAPPVQQCAKGERDEGR